MLSFTLKKQTSTNVADTTFDMSRFVITFLTVLGVTEILCSIRLVLEGKTCKEIPESSTSEFLETFSVNKFCFI